MLFAYGSAMAFLVLHFVATMIQSGYIGMAGVEQIPCNVNIHFCGTPLEKLLVSFQTDFSVDYIFNLIGAAFSALIGLIVFQYAMFTADGTAGLVVTIIRSIGGLILFSGVIVVAGSIIGRLGGKFL